MIHNDNYNKYIIIIHSMYKVHTLRLLV